MNRFGSRSESDCRERSGFLSADITATDREEVGGRRSSSYLCFLLLPVFILLIFSFYVFLWRRKSDSGSEIIDEGKEKGGGAHHPSSVLLLMPQWTGSFILLSGESLPPFLLPSDSSPPSPHLSPSWSLSSPTMGRSGVRGYKGVKGQ